MKKTLNRILFILVGSILIYSCKTKTPIVFKEVESMGRFNLQIPVYLHAASGITPFRTSMEFKDSSGTMFLVVFDTARDGIHENTLKMYNDSMVSQFMIDSAVVTPAQLIKVNNDSAYKCEMTGKIMGMKIVDEIETIATVDRYYTIFIWAKLDKKNDVKDDMDKILASFCDISNKKNDNTMTIDGVKSKTFAPLKFKPLEPLFCNCI